MTYSTPDICDQLPDQLQIAEPLFTEFGGKDSFSGEIVTIKCFEDNSLVKTKPGYRRSRQGTGRGWRGLVKVCATG